MKNIKRLTATLGLLGIIILSNTVAHAGIVLAGRASNPTTIEQVINGIRNIVIGQVTGVKLQERTPVYITD